MENVAQTPAHAKRRPEGLIAAWLCLVIAGAATVTFNIVNAWHSGMASPLGVVEGVVPVALAMIVSHLVAVSSAGAFLRGITFAVMVGALALSVRATGAVVAPAAGTLWWLYGAVVDTAALASLQVLLTLKARTREAAQERAQAETAAAGEATALRAELAALRAELAGAQEIIATAQAERADAQRSAQEAAGKAEVTARKLDALRARSARTGKGAEAPRSRRADPRATEVPSDVDAQAEALSILAAEPGISGAQLGPRVGMSKRWGQEFKKNLAGSSAGPEGQE